MASMMRTMMRAIAREQYKKEHPFSRYHTGGKKPQSRRERRGQYLKAIYVLMKPRSKRLRQKVGER
jgi:hypothetical protein